jgi:hypothetical protein
MPREKILPLPDEMDAVLLSGARAIDESLGEKSKDKTNRQFLAKFIPLVAQTLGRPNHPFGAQTYQQLLRRYSPGRSPSSSTVQSEIEAFRSATGAIATQTQTPAPTAMPVAAREAGTAPSGYSSELVEQYRHEVEFLRRRHAAMEARMLSAEADRRAAEAKAMEAIAERDALELASAKLQETLRSLSETIAVTQERAAADNRANMVRIDQMRGETRAAVSQLDEMRAALQAKSQQVLNAETLAEQLRIRNSELQRRLNDASS